MPSMTYKQICNRMKDIEDEVERLHNKGLEEDLSPEQEEQWGSLRSEHSSLNSDKKRLEREADRLRMQQAKVRKDADQAGSRVGGADELDADPLGEPDSIEDRRFRDPWDTSEVRMGLTPEQRGQELHSRALSAVGKMSGATDSVREAATQIVERFDPDNGELSHLVLAISSPAYLRAFSKLARSQGNRGSLSQEENEAVNRAMSLTDAAGGYLVPFQLDPTVILTSAGSFNQVRQIARTVVATGDVWNGVSSGAVSWSWDAEAAVASDDAPTLAQPTIPIYKAQGFVPISLEAYQDAANVTETVGTLLMEGKEELESATFVTGSGSAQPTGIVTALTGTASVVASATTDTFALADVYALDGALPARHRQRASWLANRTIYNLVRRFDTQGGAALWTQLGGDVPNELIGRPVYEAESMDSTVTATSDNLLAIFGNFNNYVIADRIGVTVEFIPHLFGANRRPTGQKGWHAYYRAGADSVHDGAFRMLNVT